MADLHHYDQLVHQNYQLLILWGAFQSRSHHQAARLNQYIKYCHLTWWCVILLSPHHLVETLE